MPITDPAAHPPPARQGLRRLAAPLVLALGAATAVTAACSATSSPKERPPGGMGGSGAGTGGGGQGATGAVGGSGATGGGGVGGSTIATMDGSSHLDPDAACEAVSQQAEERFQPADIVWAIDTSGSMIDEALAVQQNINAFSQQIIASGIDVHVVMLAGYPFFFLPGICVPGPLGSGLCPPQGSDTNLPRFFHHPASFVDSVDAAVVLVSKFPEYRHMLRPGALKHLVVVTDDDSRASDVDGGSSGNPGVYDDDPQRFIDDYTALDPMLRDPATGGPSWKMNAIYAFSLCANAARVGTVWKTIVDATGGVHGDICSCPPGQVAACQQTFQTVFNELATKIFEGAVPLDCEWGIPPPPSGQVFNPSLVNVDFTNEEQGTRETIYAVGDQGQCDPALGGWYYDAPGAPTRVIACPATCDEIKSVARGRIDISFGCQTIVIPK